jgi:hypothetical protein
MVRELGGWEAGRLGSVEARKAGCWMLDTRYWMLDGRSAQGIRL